MWAAWSVSLRTVRVSMSVLSIVIIAERSSVVEGMSSIARGSKVAMVQDNRVGERRWAIG